MIRTILLAAGFIVLGAGTALGQTDEVTIGGDQYSGGQQVSISSPVARDAFAAGFNVQITAPVQGDAHAAGYSLNLSGDVTGDVYAIGNTVNISGAVGEDVSATGSSVTLSGAGVAGNVRAAGASVVIDAPVAGSVTIGAAGAALSAPVSGDLYFGGETLSFGDGARVDGMINIQSPNDIIVPESVAPADRVTIEKVEPADVGIDTSDIARHSVQSFWPVWLPIILAPLVFMIVGVIWLALFPNRSLVAYRTAIAKPFKSLLFGLIALAAFMGLVPAVAMTLIGIPLVPVAILLLVFAGMLGYIAGAWFLSMRVLTAFGMSYETLGMRAIAMVAGLIVAGLISLIPIIGWLTQLVLIFYGLGAMLVAAMARWSDRAFQDRTRDEVTQMLAKSS